MDGFIFHQTEPSVKKKVDLLALIVFFFPTEKHFPFPLIKINGNTKFVKRVDR